MKKSLIILTLALGTSLSIVNAQDQNAPGGQRSPGREGGPGMGRPISPMIEALDLNHDGTIDADELAKASDSLKKLDKNGDGKLTQEELRPQRPGGPAGGPEGRRQRPTQ